MPQYRLSFMFEFQKQGYSEQWYVTQRDPVTATFFANQDLANFISLRPAGTTLQAIRSNDVSTPRLGYLNVLNVPVQKFLGGGQTTGEIPQAGILLSLRSAAGQRRPFIMRGIEDALINYDVNGNAQFLGQVVNLLANWFQAVQNMGLQFRTLNPADPVLNPDRPITTFASFLNDPTQTTVTYTGLALPATPVRVVFHKVSRAKFPGLQGTVPSVPGGANQIVLPVTWSNSALTVNGGAAVVRQALYSYQTIFAYLAVDFRSKKVGAPFLRARGRRTALHYRSR